MRVAAKVILWTFLVGGALSGYLTAGTLYTRVGTITPKDGTPTSFNRVNFLDMLLNNAANANKQATPEPAK